MSAATAAPERERLLRIGEVAELTGTTPRTIRYYEEIGLLPEAEDRVQGKRRLYTQADVEHLGELIRLRDLLGLSLDDLKRLVEAETARAGLRERWQHTDDPAEQTQILEQSLLHIADQLRLVRARRAELERLEGELTSKQRRVRTLMRTAADGVSAPRR
jgi:DNA-binding transcriptional MerR regulator